MKSELLENRDSMDSDVDIYALADTKCLYHIGEGHLSHTRLGFHLTGCDGKLDYTQGALASYTLNADFNWYEIGDVISIGTSSLLYYCVPKKKDCCVAKARLATEELYQLLRAERKRAKADRIAK